MRSKATGLFQPKASVCAARVVEVADDPFLRQGKISIDAVLFAVTGLCRKLGHRLNCATCVIAPCARGIFRADFGASSGADMCTASHMPVWCLKVGSRSKPRARKHSVAHWFSRSRLTNIARSCSLPSSALMFSRPKVGLFRSGRRLVGAALGHHGPDDPCHLVRQHHPPTPDLTHRTKPYQHPLTGIGPVYSPKFDLSRVPAPINDVRFRNPFRAQHAVSVLASTERSKLGLTSEAANPLSGSKLVPSNVSTRS